MKEFTGSISEFISNITTEKMGFLKKYNGKKVVGLWWFEENTGKYDLMQVCEKNLNAKEFEEKNTKLVTSKDLETFIKPYLKERYHMYL